MLSARAEALRTELLPYHDRPAPGSCFPERPAAAVFRFRQQKPAPYRPVEFVRGPAVPYLQVLRRRPECLPPSGRPKLQSRFEPVFPPDLILRSLSARPSDPYCPERYFPAGRQFVSVARRRYFTRPESFAFFVAFLRPPVCFLRLFAVFRWLGYV